MSMVEPKLKAGMTGYWMEFGKCYPARVVETGIRQSSGPVDELICYTMFGWQDHIVRTVGGSSKSTNGHWLTPEEYALVRAGALRLHIEKFDAEWPAALQDKG